jgi:ubiquinone/menaquinone biosynthesis C-methylase UbiE
LKGDEMKYSKNIWEYFQTKDVSKFEGSHSRLSFLASHFKKGDRVLNIGLGDGYFEEVSIKRGVDIYVLDPSEKSISEIRKKFTLDNKAIVGCVQDISFKENFFDGIVMTEVLEHLSFDEMEKAFLEVKRVLKLGGVFLGTVPNNEDLNERVVICPKCGEKFHQWGHQQTFTKDDLKKEFLRRFKVLTIRIKLFIPWNILNWKGKIISIVKYVLFRIKILNETQANIFFICSK